MANIESPQQPDQPPYSELNVYTEFLGVLPERSTIPVSAAVCLDPRFSYRSDGWAGYVPSDVFIPHRNADLADSTVPATELLRRINEALAESSPRADAEITQDLGAPSVAATVQLDPVVQAVRSSRYRHEQGPEVRSHRRGLVGLLKNAVRSAR